MPSERIQFLENGEVRDFGASDVAWSSAQAPWSGFRIEAHEVDGPVTLPPSTGYFADPLVLLYTGGRALLRYRIRTREYECALVPGMIRILTGEYELSSLGWSGPYAMLAVELAPEKLGPEANGHGEPRRRVLDPHFAGEDVQIATLVRSMHAEIEGGCTAGRLFAESLSSALAAYVFGRYAWRERRKAEHRPRLSSSQRRVVLEYIDAHLACEIGLSELSNAVGLSPHHFSFLFKNTFGLSPYKFVIAERVERAKRLLASRRMPIAAIASALGFSSQSHFTAVFRKATGQTPRRYQL